MSRPSRDRPRPAPVVESGEEDPVLAALGGAAGCGRLHAIHPAAPGHEAAAAGFALALLRILTPGRGPLVWVQERRRAAEAGLPYGPGLATFDLQPARLIVVSAANAMEALGAAEIGLEAEGAAGVLVELPPRLPADMLRAGKRLALRAAAREAPCLLVHADAAPVQTPVVTRWLVRSRSEQRTRLAAPYGPVLELELEKNRFGPLGRWTVRWIGHPPTSETSQDHPSRESASRHGPRFTSAAATPDPVPVVPVSADRPGGATLLQHPMRAA